MEGRTLIRQQKTLQKSAGPTAGISKNYSILLLGHYCQYFLFIGTPMMKQSTSPMIRKIPNADASQIWTWASPGKRKLAESLVTWIVSDLNPVQNAPAMRRCMGRRVNGVTPGSPRIAWLALKQASLVPRGPYMAHPALSARVMPVWARLVAHVAQLVTVSMPWTPLRSVKVANAAILMSRKVCRLMSSRAWTMTTAAMVSATGKLRGYVTSLEKVRLDVACLRNKEGISIMRDFFHSFSLVNLSIHVIKYL